MLNCQKNQNISNSCECNRIVVVLEIKGGRLDLTVKRIKIILTLN